ncbi:hypothetical protein BZA05DRAFT_225240 [Tricharina praecox]|uniref:uncharacterized protein n=1 Tax=Tricharina praecox TaxID=43433 RepID=UPI00221E8B2C|nr:uncharacterized protein BZA05DRAFT_225240 [Tricharina praecox]KAI5856043.1 hypothetical protein BZA05DRAFT_225240 [Tricharina praecox]
MARRIFPLFLLPGLLRETLLGMYIAALLRRQNLDPISSFVSRSPPGPRFHSHVSTDRMRTEPVTTSMSFSSAGYVYVVASHPSLRELPAARRRSPVHTYYSARRVSGNGNGRGLGLGIEIRLKDQSIRMDENEPGWQR